MKTLYAILFTLVCFLFIGTTVWGQSAGDFRSHGTGQWGTVATWDTLNPDLVNWYAASRQPPSTANVTILNGHTVTIEASPKTCNNLTVQNGGSLVGANTLPTSSLRYLRVYGSTITDSGNIGASTDCLGMSPYAASGQTVTVTGSGTTYFSRIQPSQASTTVIFDANVHLDYAGSAGAGSTALYPADKDNCIFTINAGKTVTMAPSAYIANHASSGTNAGSVNLTINVYGSLVTQSNSIINLNTASLKTSTLNVYNGGSISLGAFLRGDATNLGTVSINVNNGGTITGGSGSTYALSTGTTSVNGTVDFGSSSTSTRTLGTAAVAGTLRFTDNTYPTGSISLNSGSTVEYYGGSGISLGSTPATYYNLLINTAGGVTLGGSCNVTNALTLSSGTFTVGANTLTLNNPILGTPGNLSAGSSSSISIAGSASGVNIPSSVTSLSNLTLNNSNGTTLQGNLALNGTLTFTSGSVVTGSDTLAIATGGSVSGAGSGQYVYGNLQRGIPGGSSLENFDVGDNTNYTPVALSFGGGTTGGNLTVNTTGNTQPNFASSTINQTKYVKRYWTFTNSGVSGTYDATFNFVNGDIQGGGNTSNFIIGKYDGGWTYPTIGAQNSNYTKATGLTSFSDFAIGEGPVPPTMATPTYSAVAKDTAILGATIVTDNGWTVTASGVAYGTSPAPTTPTVATSPTTTSGAFTVNVNSLLSNTLYYFRGYAANVAGTGYSADSTFTTVPAAPVASAATGVGSTSFTAIWSAVSGSAAVTYRLDVSKDSLFGTFLGGYNDLNVSTATSHPVTGLDPDSTYYYRVRAVNAGGTSDQSNRISVTMPTQPPPTVTTPTAANIVDTSATLGANVTSDGGGAVTERGIVWSTTPDPTTANNKVTTTGTTGVFTVHVGSLSAKTLIHYRGFATNAGGTGYTSDTTFYTLATEPTTHAGSFTATAVSKNEIDLSWSVATGADGYIILKHAGVDPAGLPADASGYSVGAIIGTDTVAAVITSGATTTANITGLASNTRFNFSIMPFGYDGSHAATYNYKTDGTIPTANAITFSMLSDVIATPGFVYPTNIPYMNYPPTAGLTTVNSDSVFGITVRDGGAAVNDSDALPTILTALSLTVTNFSMIDHAALFDGSTNLAEVAVTASPINFSGLSVSVPDNGTKDLMLRIVFKTVVTDNARMTFTVSSVTASATGSGFAAANGGGATSSASGNDNKVAVTASKLVFTTQPTTGKLPTVNFGPVVVTAKDADNNVDVDYSTAVVISSSSVFKLNSTDAGRLTHTPVSGVATWANMTSLTAGAGKIGAASNGLTPDSSNSFTVLGTGDFRTHQAGNWNDVNTWERFDGANWVYPASITPVDSLGRKTIMSGHSVAVSADVAADSVYVNGTLTINSGVTFTVNPPSLKKERYGIITDTTGGASPAVIVSGTYKLNRDSGNVPNATWNDGSTLLVTGVKAGTSIGANPGQSYYNIVWNCPSQTANTNMGMHPPANRDTTTTVRGDISILNTGNGAVRAYLCGPPAGTTGRTVARININGKINVSNASIFSAHGTGNGNTDVYVTVLGNITVRDNASQLSISRGSQGTTGTTTWYIKSDSVIYGPGTNNQNSSDAASAIATSRGKFVFNKAGTQIISIDTLAAWTGPCNMQFGDSSTSTTVNIGNSPFIGAACVQRIKYNAKVIVGPLGYIGGGSNSYSTPAPSNFAMDNGATLVIGSAGGIRATNHGSSGAVQVNGVRTFSTGGNYEYNGAVSQKTGGGLPATVNNLTVTNAAGVTMDSTTAVTVNGTLTFNSGTFTTGTDSLHSDTLALAATASVNRISGHVVGNLRRGVNSSWNGVQKSFDIGDSANYTPVNLTFGTVSGAGSLTAGTTPAEQPNIATSMIDPARSVNRYYSFTNNGVGFDNYNAAFKFVPGDLVGSPNTSKFIVGKYNGGSWSYPTVGIETDSTTQATGLTSFSDFALGQQRRNMLTIHATHGTVTLNPPTGPYDSATVVHLTAVPATGYHFVSWADSLTGTGNPDSIVMNHDMVVTANFAIDTHTLIVHATHGTVTVTPPTGPYDYGTIVHLAAVPAMGYRFVNWTDSLTGTINPDSIVMNSDKVVTANFAINQFALTTHAVGGGTVAKNPDLALYEYGTSVVVTATPNDRSWKFSAWSGDTSGTANPITVVMDSAKSITGTFVRDSAYLYTYRSFRADSIANAGLPTAIVKPGKADKVEFVLTVVNDSANITKLHVDFGVVVIDSSIRPFTITPAATPSKTDTKGQKWDFVFVSPL
ncbi:MAG: fibronectin type III domain-containing protein, partial [Bacteroidota bacterium]